MKCPNGHEVGDNVKFCPTCGAEIVRGNKYCTKCGNERKGTEKFCSKCGTPFDGVPTSQPSPSYDESSYTNKKILIPIVVGVLVIALIGGGWWFFKGSKSNEPFETALVSFKKTAPSDNFDVTAEINIDYPQKGNSKLKDNVIDFILKALKEDFTFEEPSQNPTYEGDKYEGQAVVDFYGEAKIKEFQEGGVGEITFNIKKETDTEGYISFRLDMSGNGGGTGIGLSYGTSFNKSDGSIIQVIKDPNDSAFKDFLKSHVKSHLWKEGSIEQLDESELNAHPYPNKTPYLSKDGICFIYQKYEIGTMGKVEFVVPYSEIRLYISETALSLIELGSKKSIANSSSDADIEAQKIESNAVISDYNERLIYQGEYVFDAILTDAALEKKSSTFTIKIDGNNVSVTTDEGKTMTGHIYNDDLGIDVAYDYGDDLHWITMTIKPNDKEGKEWVGEYAPTGMLFNAVLKLKEFKRKGEAIKVTKEREADNDNETIADDNSDYSSSNTSSSSRTFYSEQIVIGYLANQSFRASDGLTMRVDGDGRLYVDGGYAGVISVLRYNDTAALLRYGGGQYGEGKLSVQIIGDKFQLTDPTDGTVYYQR